jgi:c(7)-type cytochrome triheme protein
MSVDEKRKVLKELRHAVYEYFVPTGLVLIAAMLIVSSSVVASRAALFAPKTDWPESQDPATDYSKFKHQNPNHSRLPCLLCHRRETNAARPSIPGGSNHLPCAGCHAQQFASSSAPMCMICHTDSQSGKLKPFPRLSSFNMKFDHARHVSMRNISCTTCHRPSRGGVAITIPTGFNAHTTCFRCHTPSARSGDQNISSCGVCHQPGRHVRMSETAAAFRVGFSHAKHDKSEGLSCNECHRVRAGVARRLQVSEPQPLNHHASPGAFSCMSCHNGKRAFGGDDFSACGRCHTKNTWHF